MSWQDRLKLLVEKSRFSTVSEVAGAAGISAASLGQALRGKHMPKASTLEKLADVLGTTSQYILFGEQQSPAQTVPILTLEEIPLWLMKHKCLEDFSTISAPANMNELSFAWHCDVVDMEPQFKQGTMVFFEAFPSKPSLTEKAYVMAARVTWDIAGVSPSGAQMEVIDIKKIVFRELCNSANGLMLRSVSGDYRPIPLDDYELIALAKYSLCVLPGN